MRKRKDPEDQDRYALCIEEIVEIKLETSVADLLQNHPELIPFFIQNNMSCVGCGMSKFETVGDAARIYQYDPSQFISELCSRLES